MSTKASNQPDRSPCILEIRIRISRAKTDDLNAPFIYDSWLVFFLITDFDRKVMFRYIGNIKQFNQIK